MKTKGPKLFTAMKGYTTKQLTKDIVAGILVAIIAFPLSVALAISSGMSPETGLYSAIIGGFFVSAFGGSKVNIGGVTAATVMTVFNIIEEFGLAGLAPEGWVAVVKNQKVMFEIGGVSEEVAREALRLAQHKLPIKTRIITKEVETEIGGE